MLERHEIELCFVEQRVGLCPDDRGEAEGV